MKLGRALERGAPERAATAARTTKTAGAEIDASWMNAGAVDAPGLASLRLHEPQPGNNWERLYTCARGCGADRIGSNRGVCPLYVRARLRFGTRFQERENGPPVHIALRNAFLAIGTRRIPWSPNR